MITNVIVLFSVILKVCVDVHGLHTYICRSELIYLEGVSCFITVFKHSFSTLSPFLPSKG